MNNSYRRAGRKLFLLIVLFGLIAVGARIARSEPVNCPDLDGDGTVNFTDLGLFRQSFGQAADELPACYESPIWSYSEIHNQMLERALEQGWLVQFMVENQGESEEQSCVFLIAVDSDGKIMGRFGLMCVEQAQ